MSPEANRPSTDLGRRRFLGKSGVALVGSLSTLTTGCLSSLPPLGDEQRYGRLDLPTTADSTYRKWLPAPSSLDPPVESYHFVALGSTASRPGAPEKFVAGRARVKASLDYFGVGFENYHRLVSSLLGTVIEASFDRERVVQRIVASGYERTGTYRNFSVFARADIARRVAVGDGVLVWTSSYHHESPNLEALIDAGTGHRPRFHEEDEAFERLTAAAGGPPYLGVNVDTIDPTGRPVMMADGFRFDDETAYQVVHYYYPQVDRVPDRPTVERNLREDDYRFADEAKAFDVDIDGQLATVETRIPLDDTRTVPPEYDLPQVTWGVTYDATSGRVTFRHEGGDAVPADRLFYDIGRQSAPGKIDKRPLWDGTHTVTTGATTTVSLSDEPNATDVNLVYSAGDIEFHVLIGVDLRGEVDG